MPDTLSAYYRSLGSRICQINTIQDRHENVSRHAVKELSAIYVLYSLTLDEWQIFIVIRVRRVMGPVRMDVNRSSGFSIAYRY